MQIGQPLKPREAPRDTTDVLLILSLTPLILGVVFGVPYVAALSWLEIAAAWPVAFGVGAFIGLAVFPAFTVWNLRVETGGVRFRRLLGSPRFLSWERLERIAPASRREVFCRAGLIPWREMSMSMTFRGHWRFDWEGRSYYFPPDDPVRFQETIREALTGGALSGSGTAMTSVASARNGTPQGQWPELVGFEDVAQREPPGLLSGLPPLEESGNPYQSPRT